MAAEDEDLESKGVTVELRELPEALDAAVYIYDKWPLVVDTSGQAARFLKYQRGSFLSPKLPGDMVDTNLRRALVGALRYGSWLVINFGDDGSASLEKHFSAGHFPPEVLTRSELYKEEVWTPLLRPDAGDPEAIRFAPRDDFKLIVVTETDPPPALVGSMFVITVKADEDTKKTEDEVLAAAYGIKLVKRNSKDMVEEAFDGNMEAVQSWLEKGYDLESTDGHKHTAISEAACQGHAELVKFLLSAGANPNAVNDQGRSPLYRASFNGHTDTVTLLLKSGADPRLKDKELNAPWDVTRSEEVRKVLSDWSIDETERLLEERREAIRKQQEERLRTAAERDMAARLALRNEAVELAIAGNTAGLKELLQRAADEASNEAGGRPRVKAEVRDDRGNTLLALAAWHGHFDLAKMLLTTYLEFHPSLEEVERKTFKVNVNSRDSKGWTPVAIACFHCHPKIIRLLIEHGANPLLMNLYHKNAFDNAKDKPEALEALRTWDQFTTWEAEHMKKAEDAGAGGGEGEDEAKAAPAKPAAKKKKGKGRAAKGTASKKGAKKGTRRTATGTSGAKRRAVKGVPGAKRATRRAGAGAAGAGSRRRAAKK